MNIYTNKIYYKGEVCSIKYVIHKDDKIYNLIKRVKSNVILSSDKIYVVDNSKALSSLSNKAVDIRYYLYAILNNENFK